MTCEIIIAVLGGLVGAILTSLYHYFYSKRQSKKEWRSLILSITSELVYNFGRCVSYVEQRKDNAVSFSTLFQFFDANLLSKFASVCSNPDLMESIVYLRAAYYQIGRHTDFASECAAELATERAAESATEQDDMSEQVIPSPVVQKAQKKAFMAQKRALAFFNSAYGEIEESMCLVVNETKKVCSGEVSDKLAEKFLERQSKYLQLTSVD